MRVTTEVGFAGSSAFGDFSKAKCLDLALRRSNGMWVDSVLLKVTKGDRKPAVFRASVV